MVFKLTHQDRRDPRHYHHSKATWFTWSTYLAAVNMAPLRPPNVDAATNIGMIHDITPNVKSAYVYKEKIQNQCRFLIQVTTRIEFEKINRFKSNQITMKRIPIKS